jgi:hypothetical protein
MGQSPIAPVSTVLCPGPKSALGSTLLNVTFSDMAPKTRQTTVSLDTFPKAIAASSRYVAESVGLHKASAHLSKTSGRYTSYLLPELPHIRIIIILNCLSCRTRALLALLSDEAAVS